MTEAEIIEQITRKRTELEENRSGNAATAVVEKLEAEIKELESSLPVPEAVNEEQVFLDECAG